MVEKFEIIKLSQESIFPIIRDEEGHLLPQLPATGFTFPGTIQGEGKLCGVPSLFIRLAGCNLHCCWKNTDGSTTECDTAYAAYNIPTIYSLSTDEICKIIQQNTPVIDHIVITGGEPFLQSQALRQLCFQLKQLQNYHLTIETNATLFDEELVRFIDFFSLSPKLSGSTPEGSFQKKHEQLRINLPVIQAFISYARKSDKDFQLKFVCSTEADLFEIKSILSRLKEWSNDDILLMPPGATPAQLLLNSRQTLQFCIENGWRYCDRLHLSLFGNKPGI